MCREGKLGLQELGIYRYRNKPIGLLSVIHRTPRFEGRSVLEWKGRVAKVGSPGSSRIHYP